MEAIRKCALNFVSFWVSICQRLCNSAAHEHAKFSVLSDMCDCFWKDSAPSCVTNIVVSDLAELVE
jgi:hypothetical protein